jgi:translation initiation factor 1
MASFKNLTKFDADLGEILTIAKKKLGAGGTIRDNSIEIRGDHRFRLKKILIDLGYPEEKITIEE